MTNDEFQMTKEAPMSNDKAEAGDGGDNLRRLINSSDRLKPDDALLVVPALAGLSLCFRTG